MTIKCNHPAQRPESDSTRHENNRVNVDPSLTGHFTKMKIGLLTPYGGGNLGDAAIQDAAITNIRKRYPNAVIYMITLAPQTTAKLHMVPCFPLTALQLRHYSAVYGTYAIEIADPEYLPPPTARQTSEPIRPLQRPWPPFRLLLRPIKAVLRKPWRLARNVYLELSHARHAYRFAQELDLVIVSGGGQIDDYWGGPWGHPYSLLKWGLIAKAAKINYIFLSVGTCSLSSNLSNYFAQRALALADYRSYRDAISRDSLSHMPFTRNDPVYPDLAFSHPQRDAMLRCRNSTEIKVVGISPIAYLSRHNWPEQDTAVFEGYSKALIEFIATLIKRGYNIVFFTTDGPDRAVITDIVESLVSTYGTHILDNIARPPTETTGDLFKALSSVDCVVASRLHGLLLSNLCGLPTLAISYDRKVNTHMENLGLTEHCLDIRHVDTTTLLRAFDTIVKHYVALKLHVANITADYDSRLQEQYDLVVTC